MWRQQEQVIFRLSVKPTTPKNLQCMRNVQHAYFIFREEKSDFFRFIFVFNNDNMKETRSHCFIVNIRAHTVAIVWFTQSIWSSKVCKCMCACMSVHMQYDFLPVYMCKHVVPMLCYNAMFVLAIYANTHSHTHTLSVSLFHMSSLLWLPLIRFFLSMQLKIAAAAAAVCCCRCSVVVSVAVVVVAFSPSWFISNQKEWKNWWAHTL